MNTRLIISLTLAGLLVLFIVQNVAVVDIRFLFWGVSMSRSLLLFIVVTIGIVTGWLLRAYFEHRRNK